ncbi:MAG: ABC transporter permease [Deltaproteobacteria bacterium]|nr:ABC transporter permease [Deltaproteobacteria bacterium]
MPRVIARIMRKELIQTFRDKRMVGVLFLAPVLQVVLFGYAVNLDLSAQPTVIADLDRSPESREAVQAIVNQTGFKVVAHATTHAQAERALDTGKASLALLVPRGYADDLAAGAAELLLVLDGSDSNTALRASQEAGQTLGNLAVASQRERVVQAAAARGTSLDGLLPSVTIEARPWFNPQMKTAIFLVPAVLALVLMVVTMMLTSMGLTREKEIGTLEQIMVTPVRPVELMIGKTLPFAVIGLLDVALIVSVAALVFDVPVRGSLLSLFLASGLYLMTTLGLGLFISTVSATQQQAMLNAFFVLLPALMLSGYIFPIENMPQAVQWLTIVNPLRYYIELTRGIMIKGATITDLWTQTLALAGLGALVLTAASLRFRKRIA